jgi:hydroxymethylpyrimidine/phosphomethylpyrimidine kinase
MAAPYRELPLVATPGVLIVGGLDPSGGAGFVADVRIATALRCRPVGVITALTDQNTVGVIAANQVDPAVIANQLSTLLTDVEVAAVKIGMIGSHEIARAVADALALTAAPVVWDPVIAPTRGAPLFEGDLAAAVDVLAPHLALITPNATEAGLLTGRRVDDEAAALGAGRELRSRGIAAVLIKGGHLGSDEATDYLVATGDAVALRGPRIPITEPVHGTGCALSTAIACRLAHGIPLRTACEQAKELVSQRLLTPVHAGRGRGSVL